MSLTDDLYERARDGDGLASVAYGLIEVANAIASLREVFPNGPLFGENLGGIESALDAIADAIKQEKDQ